MYVIYIYVPGENGATVATVLSSTTSLRMSFIIRMNSVSLGTFLARPLLFAVFPTEMFFDTGEIAQSSSRVMVDASLLRANIDTFPHFFTCPLL